MRLIQLTLFTLCVAFLQPSQAQDQIIDEIVAIVGDNIILRSDLESQRLQALEQGITIDEDVYCFIMDKLLFEKLLLHQADLDSIEVTDGQIEGEMDRRLNYFISQLGSEEKLEEFYGKSIVEIKAELYDLLKDQLRAQQVQGTLTQDIKVTPSEVKEFYESMHPDSLPIVGAEVEVAQIVRRPVVSKEAKDKVTNQLEKMREEMMALSGSARVKRFETNAILYSEDPGSAKQGGKLGMTPRGNFVPEFSAAAFDLAPGEISQIVETDFGYHIIQLIERRGEQINCRHILMKPKVGVGALNEAKEYLDSVANLIRIDSISFERAAAKFSDDEDSKNSNGLIMNQYSGTSRFKMEEVEPALFLTIDKMKVGDMSNAVYYQTREGAAYRLLKLNVRTSPHRANMKDDYQLLQTMALNKKKGKAIDEWVRTRINSSYIRIDDQYKNCDFQYEWLVKQ